MKGNFHVRFLGECRRGNLPALTRLYPTKSDQLFCRPVLRSAFLTAIVLLTTAVGARSNPPALRSAFGKGGSDSSY